MSLRAAAIAAVLLAGGCGDDGADDAAVAPSSSSTVGTLPGGDTVPPPDAASTTVAPDGGTTAPTGDTTVPPATPTSSAPGDPPPPTLDANVAAGRFAPALLRPDLSERLVIEVHADVEPRSGSVAHVADLLGEVSGKPVSVVVAAPPAQGAREWTSDELRAAADAGSTSPQGGGVAVVRLLFVRGTFRGDEGVLGVAVRGDVAAVFVDRVEAAGGLLGGSAAIEEAVTAHELGHLVGLVDLVLDTGRADPEHPGHSRNERSVMYWAVESDLVGQVLGADPPSAFDADDLADLATIRGGG